MHHVWNDNSKHIFSETIFLTLVEAYNDNVLNDIWIDTAITNKQKKKRFTFSERIVFVFVKFQLDLQRFLYQQHIVSFN